MEQHHTPHHKLIYGAAIKNKVECKMIEPFQKFTLPKRDGSDHYFIGFQYGQVDLLYDKLHSGYGESFTVCHSKPSQEIKDLFKQCYPDLKTTTYALFQNVYTSLFSNGVIMYGYWISNFDYDGLYTIQKMEVCVPAHTMENKYSDKQFIGIILTELPSFEDQNPKDLHKVAKKLTKRYKKPIDLARRSNLLTELSAIDPEAELSPFPMFAVIPLACHCCT